MTDLQADLLDALASALVVTNRDGDILLWNRAAERLYGYPRDRMRGANVMQMFVAEVNTAEATSIMDKVLAGETWTGDFPVTRADGATVRVRITDSPVIRGGEVIAVVGLAEPVDEQEVVAPASPSTEGLSDLALALAELDGLRTAMRTRGTIEQAKGIVMASLGVDATTAFDVLRKMSQRSNRKLVDVAQKIVDSAPAGRESIRRQHIGAE